MTSARVSPYLRRSSVSSWRRAPISASRSGSSSKVSAAARASLARSDSSVCRPSSRSCRAARGARPAEPRRPASRGGRRCPRRRRGCRQPIRGRLPQGGGVREPLLLARGVRRPRRGVQAGGIELGQLDSARGPAPGPGPGGRRRGRPAAASDPARRAAAWRHLVGADAGRGVEGGALGRRDGAATGGRAGRGGRPAVRPVGELRRRAMRPST